MLQMMFGKLLNVVLQPVHLWTLVHNDSQLCHVADAKSKPYERRGEKVGRTEGRALVAEPGNNLQRAQVRGQVDEASPHALREDWPAWVLRHIEADLRRTAGGF